MTTPNNYLYEVLHNERGEGAVGGGIGPDDIEGVPNVIEYPGVQDIVSLGNEVESIESIKVEDSIELYPANEQFQLPTISERVLVGDIVVDDDEQSGIGFKSANVAIQDTVSLELEEPRPGEYLVRAAVVGADLLITPNQGEVVRYSPTIDHDNNYVDSFDLRLSGTTLHGTLGRNGTLPDLDDSVNLASLQDGNDNNYIDNLVLNLSGQNLSATVEREGLSNFSSNTITLPSPGGGWNSWDQVSALPNRGRPSLDNRGRQYQYIPISSISPTFPSLGGQWGFLDITDIGGGADNYADSVDLAFSNGSLGITIGRTGTLSDLTDSVAIPDNNNYADSLDVGLSGQTLSVTIGRNGTLADLTDSVELPSGGGSGTFFGLTDTPDSGMITRTTPGTQISRTIASISSSIVVLDGDNYRRISPLVSFPSILLPSGRNTVNALAFPFQTGIFLQFQINGNSDPLLLTVNYTNYQVTVTNNSTGQSGTKNLPSNPFLQIGNTFYADLGFFAIGAGVGTSITIEFRNAPTTTTEAASGYFFAVNSTGDELVLTPPPSGITDEHIQDVVGSMMRAGSGLQGVYNDTLGTFTYSSTGSGGGGTPAEYIRRITASGNTLSWDSIGGTDGSFTPTGAGRAPTEEEVFDLTKNILVGGTNVTITDNDTTNRITIDAVGGGGSGPTREQVEDWVAQMFTGGTHTGISYAYDDANGEMDSTVTGGGGNAIFSPVRIGGGSDTIDSNQWSATNVALPTLASARWLMVRVALDQFSFITGWHGYFLINNEELRGLNAGTVGNSDGRAITVSMGGEGGTTDRRIVIGIGRDSTNRMLLLANAGNNVTISYEVYRIEASVQSPVGPDGVVDFFGWNNTERELTLRTTSGFIETVTIPAGSGGDVTEEQVFDHAKNIIVGGTNVTVLDNDTNNTITISASGGGSGTTYNEGDGIDISGSTISVDFGSGSTQAAPGNHTHPGGGVAYSEGDGIDISNSNVISVDFGSGATQAAPGNHTHTSSGSVGVSSIIPNTGLDVSPLSGTGNVTITLDLSELSRDTTPQVTNYLIMDTDQKALISDIFNLYDLDGEIEGSLSEIDDLTGLDLFSGISGTLTASQYTAITGGDKVIVETANGEWHKVNVYQFMIAALRSLIGNDSARPNAGQRLEWDNVSQTSRVFWTN